MTCIGSSVPKVKVRKCEALLPRIRAQQAEKKHNDIAVENYQESPEQVVGGAEVASRETEAGQTVAAWWF